MSRRKRDFPDGAIVLTKEQLDAWRAAGWIVEYANEHWIEKVEPPTRAGATNTHPGRTSPR